MRLRSADAATVPVIDQRLFTDPDGNDAAVLADGVELARAVAGSGPLAIAAARPGGARRAAGRGVHAVPPGRHVPHGSEPARRDAVVDADGRVQGVDGLRVADASILPTIPRANTHLTVLAVAEAMAERLDR